MRAGERDEQRELPVAIIGAGFAGVGMGIRLQQQGIPFTIFEGADQLGGTWRENTYPGCACDVPSHLYSFSFARNPDWSRAYSPQPEILAYLEDVVDRFGLRPHIRFGSWVESAAWDDDESRWRLTLGGGETVRAKTVVAGTGPLRTPSIPDLPGRDEFEGAMMHTAQWDHDYDFTGKRVAVIGTGASAIQLVPELAKEAGELHLFQRTPPWVLPKLDGDYSRTARWLFSLLPALTFFLRYYIYWFAELLGTGFFVDVRINRFLQFRGRGHIRQTIEDPALREKVTPSYMMGCKRILFSNEYYPALNRENVELIDQGVESIGTHSVRAEDGTEREVDAVVFGTGFRVEEFLTPLRVTGRGGQDLNETWRQGAEAYYGITVSGFPNLFVLVGPNTGLGHNSIIFMIEAQVNYVLQCIERIHRGEVAALEVKPDVVKGFNKRIQERLRTAVWNAGGCNSWYLDENGKNVTLWPGYTFEYWLRTRWVDWEAYDVTPDRRRLDPWAMEPGEALA